LNSFSDEQAHWLDDYALFRALKASHNDACYPRLAEGTGSAQAGRIGQGAGVIWRTEFKNSASLSSYCIDRGHD